MPFWQQNLSGCIRAGLAATFVVCLGLASAGSADNHTGTHVDVLQDDIGEIPEPSAGILVRDAGNRRDASAVVLLDPASPASYRRVSTTTAKGTIATGLSGIVTAAATGDPVFTQSIAVFDAGGDLAGFDSTAADGTYELVLTPGTYSVATNGNSNALVVDQLYDGLTCIAGPFSGAGDPITGTPVVVIDGFVPENIDSALDAGGIMFGTVRESTTGFEAGATPSIFAFDLAGALVTAVQRFFRCDVTRGTPIGAAIGLVTPDIDFELRLAAIFTGGFESGDTTAWSSASP